MANILSGIADAKSLELFDAIREAERAKSSMLLSSLQMTRKQFYSRIVLLRDKGLIRKNNCEYSLSSFGKVVAHALEIIERAYEENWKFKAIDGAQAEDKDKLCALLITDVEMQQMLCKVDK